MCKKRCGLRFAATQEPGIPFTNEECVVFVTEKLGEGYKAPVGDARKWCDDVIKAVCSDKSTIWEMYRAAMYLRDYEDMV